MKPILTTDPIPQAQVNAWKESFPKRVFSVEVPTDDSEEPVFITGYFRKPSIEEIGIATAGSNENPVKGSLIIYNTCFLGGHSDFINDEDVKTAALSQFKDILKVRSARLVKL